MLKFRAKIKEQFVTHDINNAISEFGLDPNLRSGQNLERSHVLLTSETIRIWHTFRCNSSL